MMFKDATAFLANNSTYLIIAFGVLVVITYAIMINLWLDLSYMKKKYNKMMAGVDGGNLERLINGHMDEVSLVSSELKQQQRELERLDEILKKAITRIAVVRFDAFNDMSSDLSYCVAMLDTNNNAVVSFPEIKAAIVISGIFGREDSRTYVKPIVDGVSTYKLTHEEEQALSNAMKQ